MSVGEGPRRSTHDVIRVGLVDDHRLVREGLELILGAHPDLIVVGNAADPAEAFEVLDKWSPDVMLVDLSLGRVDGIPLVRALLTRKPALRVVVVSMHRDAETVRQALFAGASAYVVKGAHSAELIEAIRAVARGERYLHSEVTAAIVDDSMRWLKSGPLSAREREVLALLAAGKTSVTIATLLGISAHTVRRHTANMSAKLGIHGSSALIRYATTHGIARDSDTGA